MATEIRIGDYVHLKNKALGYLDTCGYVKYEVAYSKYSADTLVQTSEKADRDHYSGTWRIVSAVGKPTGQQLLDTDLIHLQNGFPGGGYLSLFGAVDPADIMTFQEIDPHFAGGGTHVFTVGDVSLAQRKAVAAFTLQTPEPGVPVFAGSKMPITTDSSVTLVWSRPDAWGRPAAEIADRPSDFTRTAAPYQLLQAVGPLNRLVAAKRLTVDYPAEQNGFVVTVPDMQDEAAPAGDADYRTWTISLRDNQRQL